MPRNKTVDLRNHLFAALEEISDAATSEDLDTAIKRAKAVSGVAREINASAKNEIQYLNLLSRHGRLPDQDSHQHLLGDKKPTTKAE